MADLDLRTPAGSFKSLALRIDSGAIISLLRRSTAASLGITPHRGRPVELSGVGGGKASGFIHMIETRFGVGLELSVPYLVSIHENVPNLLGRFGVFDQLNFLFDSRTRSTSVLWP